MILQNVIANCWNTFVRSLQASTEKLRMHVVIHSSSPPWNMVHKYQQQTFFLLDEWCSIWTMALVFCYGS